MAESYENLDRLDRELVSLEKDPQNRESLAGVFRTIHTIKGTCGFLGFGKLEKVAHSGENLLSLLRDGRLSLTPEITTVLLGKVDAMRQILAEIKTTGQEGDADYSDLLEQLTRLQSPSGKSDSHSVAKSLVRPPARAKEAAPASAEAAVPPPKSEAPAAAGGAAASETIRVGVNLLDNLMTLVGELVLARNQLLQYSNVAANTNLQTISQRMNLIATELQGEVMKTRMQPIGNIWNQFPRTVRDVALGCGKEVAIEMEGKETELDKTIIDAIKDPLTHLVRNAVDHGIEPPEVRVKAGKARAGRLLLRAFHEGGQVNIEIRDDGAGLNRDRIRQKAVERGVVTAEQSARLTEREIYNLIMLPGFSTAEKVTNVSGRGVGMDVVKTNVEKSGGTVDVQPAAWQGTTVRVKIPLTLAIIPGLVVTCAGDRYAIPQVSLLELVAPPPAAPTLSRSCSHVFPRIFRSRLSPCSTCRRSSRRCWRSGWRAAQAFAPGNFHMTVKRTGMSRRLSLNQDPPENSCRSAVDVLFRSVASVYGASALGIVMTGMGSDGVLGSQKICEVGGHVIVQDEASSVVWGMPGLVYAAGHADAVFPLTQLAGEITRRVVESRSRRSSDFAGPHPFSNKSSAEGL